jgi:hypothetical protein
VLAGEQLSEQDDRIEKINRLKEEGSDYAEPSVEGSGRVDYRKPPSH